MPRTRKDEAHILVDAPLIRGRYAEREDYSVSPAWRCGVSGGRGLRLLVGKGGVMVLDRRDLQIARGCQVVVP